MRRFYSYLGVITLLGLSLFLLHPSVSHAASKPDIIDNLCAGANLQVGSSCASGAGGANAQLNHIIKLIINILSLIVGVVAVVMIIIGGMRYITSGGSDSGVTGAKNTILYAIIGLVIVASAQMIIRFVLNRLFG